METFVVRLWVPGESGYPADPALRGVVSHVASGCSEPFAGADELLAFVARMADGSDRGPLQMREREETQAAPGQAVR